jgi:hypothetical protein
MYHIEVLRTWRLYWRYLIVLAAIYVLVSIIAALSHYGPPTDLGIKYSAGGHAEIVAFVCLLIASILGSSLSRHRDHVDFAMTKPRSRSAFVANVFGVDSAGLVVIFLTTTVAFVALHIAVGETHSVIFDASSWYGIALAFGGVLAWYAIVQAVTCTQDTSRLAIIVVAAAAIILLRLGWLDLGPGLNGLVAALNLVNPVTYLTTIPFYAVAGPASLSLVLRALAIYLVAAVAGLIALVRWQRVEV